MLTNSILQNFCCDRKNSRLVDTKRNCLLVVRLIFHEPFELSSMPCEGGGSKNPITFDCIGTLSGILGHVNWCCKENTVFCLRVHDARSNTENLNQSYGLYLHSFWSIHIETMYRVYLNENIFHRVLKYFCYNKLVIFSKSRPETFWGTIFRITNILMKNKIMFG